MEQPIYEYLIKCIDERDCSLMELADRSGVAYDTLCKIAQRKTMPRLDNAEKLLKCFPPMPAVNA